jgi:hypothetical protein
MTDHDTSASQNIKYPHWQREFEAALLEDDPQKGPETGLSMSAHFDETFLMISTGQKHRLLSFTGLRFYGLGCGEFPISVGLVAQGTRMQFTSFLGRCTTSRTRHG